MGQRKTETPWSMVVIFCVLLLTSNFLVSFSAAKHLQNHTMTRTQLPNRFGSSLVFPVRGDIYPNGYFYAIIYIGNPPRPYYLDIDTGSNLTWVQCAAASSAKLLKAPNNPYKPNNNALFCKDPLCAFIDPPTNYPCKAPNDQCDYEVHYADYGSSLGVLVRDSFPLRFTNGSVYRPTLAFGCGYDQEFSGPFPPPYVDGVLGLGNSKSSILSQLRGFGLTRNVIGHCFGSQGRGFLFFGDDLLPPGLVWAPMLYNSLNHYMLGPVDLLFGGKPSVAKGLNVVFDSGSTYTYLNPKAYQAVLSMIKTTLTGTPLTVVEDGNLPVCWKGANPFGSIDAIKNNFRPLVLSFTKSKNNVAFQLAPEAYLLVTSRGNVCLGILNGADAELGNLNVIGDISLQDKLVVYDNERQMIGWTPSNCNNIPNS
ncbi:Aspartic proteinase [Actinidia chinensis var. chinensis]|uniref:Aspartic proteinase Asp1 n=1 Tax=Actinidia chinensis var. chinensis TaxID=1590841 RepID=A0A2R6RPE4_ACTCC|nr:Aspartic proteinase [Actinidia chinensis var. chinensis]